VAGAGLAVLALLSGLYGARNYIAREALIGWLRDRGVPAQADLSGLGLGGVAGRIVVGPPNDPDFTVEHSEVAYGLTGFWSGEPFGLNIRSVRLVRPVVKARLVKGRLSFGALDPLIAEFRRHPPRPDARQPLIRVEGGRLNLATDYGRADVRAEALMNDGKLLRLDARLAPTRLVVRGTSADLSGLVRLRTRDDRVDILVDAVVPSLASSAAQAEGARLRLSGRAPYPDFTRSRADGVVSLRFEAAAKSLTTAGGRYDGAALSTTLSGRSAGWFDAFSLTGAASGDVAAARAALGSAVVSNPRAHIVAGTLAWRPKGDRLTADFRLVADASSYAQDALRLKGLKAGFQGVGAFGGADGPKLTGDAAFSARGSVAGLAPMRGEAAEAVAIKRALADFELTAPAVRVALKGSNLALALAAPVRAESPGGGSAALTAAAGRPVFAAGQGAFDLALAGGGLPQAQAAVRGLRFTEGAAVAPLTFTVHSNFDPVREGLVQGAGVMRIADGAVVLTARDCLSLSAARLEFGDNDVLKLQGRLCPVAEPLFRYAGGAWRVRGRVADAAAQIPLLQAAVSEASGPATFGGHGATLSAEAQLDRGKLDDTAPQRRFYPVHIAGPAILREGVWQMALTALDPAGRKLGEVQLSHDVRTGVGEAEVDTGLLDFEEGGLQPAALSPLAASIGSPARGQVGFTGDYGWSADGQTSRGQLTIRTLDFNSPMGAVSGLKGEIAFTNLAPLVAAPGQRLRADRIAAFAPASDAQVAFGLDAQALRVESGQAGVGGGLVRLEPFAVPLTAGAAWSGILGLEGVQVSGIVKTSPFGDRVDLDAKLTGRIPFTVTPEGVRVAGGELHAIAPGRLSIRRDALIGVAATGGVPVAPGSPATPEAAPNAFSDFAYQAMEHLAFDTLSAGINSLPKGRLGVLLHIKGHSDPPQKQVLRVGVNELVNRTFLDKPQLLPSGTKVDLTLDTSLNLDQLLGDFAGYQKLHSSAEVQAGGATNAPASAERTQ